MPRIIVHSHLGNVIYVRNPYLLIMCKLYAPRFIQVYFTPWIYELSSLSVKAVQWLVLIIVKKGSTESFWIFYTILDGRAPRICLSRSWEAESWCVGFIKSSLLKDCINYWLLTRININTGWTLSLSRQSWIGNMTSFCVMYA